MPSLSSLANKLKKSVRAKPKCDFITVSDSNSDSDNYCPVHNEEDELPSPPQPLRHWQRRKKKSSPQISEVQPEMHSQGHQNSQHPLVQKLEEVLAIAGKRLDKILGSKETGNRPIVKLLCGNIHHCYGCKKDIRYLDYQYPYDTVFSTKADIKVKNMTTNSWFTLKCDVHFHPHFTCLRMFDASLGLRQLTISDEVFLSLTTEQLEGLHVKGFLESVVKNLWDTIP